MDDRIVGLAIVLTAWAYQILVGRRSSWGWPFAIASYLVWGADMVVKHQWGYVGAAAALALTALYNWWKWRK